MAAISALIEQRLPFLQNVEEALQGRHPVICTDLSRAGTSITTPRSLQHVGEQIIEIAKADWTSVKGLRTAVAYLGDLLEFWTAVFQRHQEAGAIFAAARERPYCLFLLSFSEVTIPIEVEGGRAVAYLNEPSLPANLATTLMAHQEWLNPVSCLHTDDMQLLTRVGKPMPSFRVHTLNWQAVLDDAIASSGIIVFYLGEQSPGVEFEIGRVRHHGLEQRTVVVHKGRSAPEFCRGRPYAAVIPIDNFLVQKRTQKTGPGDLSKTGMTALRELASTAKSRTAPSRRLQSMCGAIVDPGAPAGFSQSDPETSYFVTDVNAAAFISYVQNLPDAMLRWNAISQDMRLRNIQPRLDDFNALYLALRMAFVSAACLGFTASIALTTGLLSKVASIVKNDEYDERVELYMQALDTAVAFDALTERRAWGEKIEAYRDSILEDPFG